MDKSHLSLADLEAFDSQAPQRTGERRFLCPLCGQSKARDAAHRSLCLNTASGLWNCKRCGEKGRLRDFRDEGTTKVPRKRAQMALQRAFELAPAADDHNDALTDFRPLWAGCQPLGSEAVRYLERRGISRSIAELADVRFHPRWHGREALVFPFKDPSGQVVAIGGRTLLSGGIDKPASGPKKHGAFWAPWNKFGPLDPDLPAIIVCEAPIDALSLAMAGFPALAIGGTSPPVWLAQKCAFRRVILGFDADEAGDNAWIKVGAHLRSFGARCERLRPQGAKDWNELLKREGIGALEAIFLPLLSSSE